MGRTIFALAVLFAWASNALAELPSWVKGQETQVRHGNLLDVVCEGTGPSLELARRAARESCQATASDHLSSAVRVRSVAVESESDLTLHQEVVEDRRITGLRCELQKESIAELESQTKVYQHCTFDLGAAAVAATVDEVSPRPVNNSSLGSLESKRSGAHGRHLASSERRILLVVAPACDSLMVEGEKPRIIRCRSNPQSLLLGRYDQRVIVRARGFIPKTIPIPKEGVSDADPIQILLQRAD